MVCLIKPQEQLFSSFLNYSVVSLCRLLRRSNQWSANDSTSMNFPVIQIPLNPSYPVTLLLSLPTQFQHIMTSYQFEFFRHAPSQHNLVKDQWKLHYGDKSFKNLQEFKEVKYSHDLIDSNLILQQTCHNARDHLLDFNKIELVICSPLRRCLETCKSLIQGREKQVKVVVEPLLSCRIGAVWDIGSSPKLLHTEHPSYDFSSFQEWGQLWQFRLLAISRELNWQQIQKNKQSWPLHLLDYIRKEGGENFVEFFKRTRLLKPRFAEIIKRHKFQDQGKKRILVVAHACAFSFMLGKELSNSGKGKIKDKVSFTHGEPKRFSEKEVLQDWEEKRTE